MFIFFLMIRRPPRSTLDRSSAASDVYKRQVVHYAGVACDMENILKIAKEHNLKIIEDAAQGIDCLLYTSPSPRDRTRYRMPSSA